MSVCYNKAHSTVVRNKLKENAYDARTENCTVEKCGRYFPGAAFGNVRSFQTVDFQMGDGSGASAD